MLELVKGNIVIMLVMSKPEQTLFVCVHVERRHTRTHAHTHTHARARAHTRTRAHACAPARACASTHARTLARTRAHASEFKAGPGLIEVVLTTG